MSKWETRRLEELVDAGCSLSYGIVQPGEEFPEGLPVVRPTDLTTKVIPLEGLKRVNPATAKAYRRTELRGGELLLCVRGTTGVVAIASEELAGANVTRGIVPIHFHRSRIIQEFGYYALVSSPLQEQIREKTYGTALRQINIRDLRNLALPAPPLPDQRRIVGLLDQAFDAIAAAKANAEKNLENASGLFDIYLRRLFALCSGGWVEKTVGEVCELRSGTTLPADIEKPSGDIPYLKVADMNIVDNLNGVCHSSRYVNKCDVKQSSLLPIGTTIFPKRGGAILTNKKRLTKRPICADLNIMGVTPKPGLLPEFVFNFFLRVDLREMGSGSSIPQINNYDIAPLRICFPQSTAAQQESVDILNGVRAQTQRLETLYRQKLAALDALKQSLLHQAFTGAL